MNRFARSGETADPCGVPFVRCSRAPSGRCSGAASHRSTYNSAQRQSVTALTARTHEVPRHLIEELLDVEIDHPVVLPAPLPDTPRSRHGPTCAAGSHRSPGETVVRPRLQLHGHDRLRDPVGDRRHAQHAGPVAVRLGDLDRLDRGREEDPELIRFQISRGCPARSASSCSRSCPSTPGAPLLALPADAPTPSTSGMTNGLGV